MKSEIKKLPRGQVELTIELTTEEYQPFLEQAAKSISENIKIPGFRPGKADFDLIKQKVGEAEIWQQAIELAVRKTLLKVIDEQKLLTVGPPQIDVVKLAPGNDVIYKATVSLLPQVQLCDYKKIKVTKKPTEVKPEEITKTLTDLQKMRAKETITNRQAAKGDKMEIDFETFLDKVAVDNGQNKKFALVLGEGTFIPGFEEELIGLAKNDIKNFSLKFPENYHQKNLAGKMVDFKVKINEVYNLESPVLNDEFAKALGNFETIKDVEEQIKKSILTENESKESLRQEEEILDKIIDQSQFDDIADVLVNSETKKMFEELEHNLSHQGLKIEDYLTHLKKSHDEMLLDFAPQAIKRVKSALVIRKIKEDEKIEASQEEIDAEVQKTLADYAHDPKVAETVKQPAYRDYLANILAARKVIEYLKSAIVK